MTTTKITNLHHEMETLVEASGESIDTRYNSWAKSITALDPHQSNGFMLVGNFITGTVEIEIKPSLYLVSWGSGSMKHHTQKYQLIVMNTQGELTLDQKTDDGEKGWALRLKPRIQELLSNFTTLPAPDPATDVDDLTWLRTKLAPLSDEDIIKAALAVYRLTLSQQAQ